MESLVNTLVLAVVVHSQHEIDVFRLITNIKQFVTNSITDGPLLGPVQVKFVLDEAVTIVDKHEILFEQVYLVLKTGRFHVFKHILLKERMNGRMQLILRLLYNLNLNRVLFLISGRSYIAIEYKMAFIIGLVINNIDSGLFGIKNDLGILL